VGERTWPPLLHTLLRGDELSTADTTWAMSEIMNGAATPVQIASFAVALRAKGETPGEIAGLVDAMLARRAGWTSAPFWAPIAPATQSMWWAPAATGHTP
jgi:anthranilate phosphoribosyltransferase